MSTSSLRRASVTAASALVLVVSLLLAAAAPAHAADTRSWSIDALQVKGVRIQESGVFSNGDEFYIAQIGFRSKVGVPGSTTAWFQGGLSEVKLHKGNVKTIPEPMGRVAYSSVTRCGVADIAAGCRPELIGSISIAFESDATPWSAINSKMRDIASTVRTQVAPIVESMTLADVAAPDFSQRFGQQLSTAGQRIRAASVPSTWEAIGLWLRSFGDPDDRIGIRINLFAGVDASLAGAVDGPLASAVASQGVGGALSNRSYVQRFEGDGATYDVTFHVY